MTGSQFSDARSFRNGSSAPRIVVKCHRVDPKPCGSREAGPLFLLVHQPQSP